MKPVKTYTRSMSRWWLRNPNYKWYLLREGTSLMVLAYAVFLLIGLASLANGAEAYATWRSVLQSPLSILVHLLVLAGLVYHTWTWFGLLPQTMPLLRFKGQQITNAAVVRTALAVWVVVSVVILILAMGAL